MLVEILNVPLKSDILNDIRCLPRTLKNHLAKLDTIRIVNKGNNSLLLPILVSDQILLAKARARCSAALISVL